MSGRPSRVAAAHEVALVFAAVHVAFRAFRRFTELGRAEAEAGLVYSPGLVMIAASVALIVARRRRFAAYGLTTSTFGRDVRAGVVALVLVALAGAALLPLGLERAPARIGPRDALVYVPAALAVTGALLLALERGWDRRLPKALALAVVALAIALPLVATSWTGHTLAGTAATVGWVVLGAGVGEEVFFRGYVQSRLDEAWGTPWSLLGTRFGAGLVLASLLFGLVHALNPTDYFAGRWELRPWHGLVTAAMPYGFLRARTGSVVAPAVLHALLDLGTRLPGLLGRG